MTIGCGNYLMTGIVNNPVLVRFNKYGTGIMDDVINNTDKLSNLVKFFETFFRGFQQLIVQNPVSTSALKVIKQTTNWLSAVQILGDGDFFIHCASHVKKGFLDFSKKSLGVAGHLFATLNFAKDCGSSACIWLDQQIGKLAIFGAQLSLKAAKDLAGILSGAIGVVQNLNTILYDKEGNHRINLLQGLKEFWKDETIVKLINNISKIYILSGVILGAPYTIATFIVGLALGTTTMMGYSKSYEDDQKKLARDYHAKEDLIQRIPVSPRSQQAATAA